MTEYIYNMGLRFKAVARNYPGNAALIFPDNVVLDYKTLDEKSDCVATHFMRTGLKCGSVVAIFAEKRPMTYIAMLAALKIGAPYVVLDTRSPKQRLDKILERCQPALLLTEDEGFSWDDRTVLKFHDLESAVAPIAMDVIEKVTGATPAYLMFTSGSTGFPKGVTVSHANMLNFCHWARETFQISPQDIFAGANALYFDNSVFDFTASLFNGACLVPIDYETVKQPKFLVERVQKCTVWFSVPSLLIYLTTMRALTKGSWPAMRTIIFGGEGFAKSELKKLHDMYAKQATLWNVYGPTECTCICSAKPIGNDDFRNMEELAALGHLAPNFGGLVMNDEGKSEVADGETGELYLAGPQVALGYYNDPERTRASFVANPLMPNITQPCYRTGDLVYRDPQTQFYHFVGRKDNQIKHMGYRIELEEIENALASFPEVAQSAVIYHKSGGPAGRIVAFLKTTMAIDEAIFKERLRDVIPSYMVPETLQVMTELPKNANGKVDRKALVAQYADAMAVSDKVKAHA